MLGLVVFLALAADLNAPITPKAPTLGSEIRRGIDAAEACRDTTLTTPNRYGACIDAAHDQNRQSLGQGFEAFDAGLYSSASQWETISVGVLAKRADADTSRLAVLKASLIVHTLAYERARDGLHLTDQDVRHARFSD